MNRQTGRWRLLPVRFTRGARATGRGRRRPGTERYGLGPAPARPPRRSLPGWLRNAVDWQRLLVGGGALAILLGLALGTYALVQSDVVRVQSVTVEGAQITDTDAIRRVADLDGDSLLTLDGNGAAQRIVAALPSVKAAHVERNWPQGATIRVVEHQGWGYWQGGGRRSVVDAEGQVVEQARSPRPGAITIFELGTPSDLQAHADADTVRLVERLDEDGSIARLRVTPERFEFTQERGLTIRVADGPDVVFGDSHDYDFKVAAWGALLDRIEAERLEVSEIDLRFGPQLVMRYDE